MAVFIDTSAIFAMLDADDRHHEAASAGWKTLAERREPSLCSNYVLVECFALLGRRLGHDAVRAFQTQIVPVLQVNWVTETVHERAVAALLTAGSQSLSLVDCVSFELMRELGIDRAFAFDAHFAEQGFRPIS